MEDYDRQARPWLYPWLKKNERPAARRAKGAVKMIPHPTAPTVWATV